MNICERVLWPLAGRVVPLLTVTQVLAFLAGLHVARSGCHAVSHGTPRPGEDVGGTPGLKGPGANAGPAKAWVWPGGGGKGCLQSALSAPACPCTHLPQWIIDVGTLDHMGQLESQVQQIQGRWKSEWRQDSWEAEPGRAGLPGVLTWGSSSKALSGPPPWSPPWLPPPGLSFPSFLSSSSPTCIICLTLACNYGDSVFWTENQDMWSNSESECENWSFLGKSAICGQQRWLYGPLQCLICLLNLLLFVYKVLTCLSLVSSLD